VPHHFRPRTATLAVTLAAVLALVAAGCVKPPPPAPGAGAPEPVPDVSGPVTGVAVAATVAGFHNPWEIAFLPDGTPLVTERGGTLTAIVGGARRVVGAVPGVVANGEGGLMGLAVDPGFTANRQVYVCFASSSNDVRIARFRVADDLGSLGPGFLVLGGIPWGSGNRHLGCRLRVGPDGALWATTGDAARGINPQDPTSLAGKVLRMNLDGTPAAGNPGGGWNPYVYTIGHRNPQGLAFRPSDGAAFSVEHGTGCDDEVNRLVAGANYGWAPGGGAGGYDENAPMTFPGGTPAVWSSGCPTVAPSGATFVSGARWGGWNDQLAVAVLKGSELMFVRIDGSTLAGTDFRLTDKGRLRTVQQGPDGRLWVAQDSSSASILLLDPV